jgi:hypothetical protein
VPTTTARAGGSSAHSPSPGRPRILYCREDQLLELVQRDTTLCRAHPRLRHVTAAGAAAVLRQHDMILVGDYHRWTLETDDNTTTLNAGPMPTALHARIPAQPDGNQF